MSKQDLLEAFKLIEDNRSHPDAYFSGPRGESLICKAEAALSLSFPSTYRLFLKKYGRGGIGSVEFDGIINESFETNGMLDSIGLTLEARKDLNLPSSIILIASTGDGAYYSIDCSRVNEEGESPVVVWEWFEEGGVIHETMAEDFGQFLLETLKNMLEDEDEQD